MRVFLAGAQLQLRILRRQPFDMIVLFTLPLQTAAFLSIFRYAGRSDLDAYAIIAPALIALWSMSLMISGEIIAKERDNQSLESLIAAPGSISVLLLGRISAVTAISLVGFAEALLTGWLLFGVVIDVAAPAVLAVSVLTTAAATAATAIVMSVVFILARSPRIFQNSLSYPFFLLGGVLVPTALYPHWVQGISNMIYLSWAADLMRDAVGQPVVDQWMLRNVIVLALGALALGIGLLLLRSTLRKARKEGKIGVL